MAAGQPDAPQLNAGLSAQQLVTPMQPLLTTDAVSQLVDQFRKGAIGMADIQDRIGAEAMAQKRAHIEQLQEYVSPGAIQSRMAQIGAQGAGANLQTAQAQAGTGLVQPLTESNLQDIVQHNATRLNPEAVKNYTSINPPIYKLDAAGNPTSEYDYEAMSREGAELTRAMGMRDYAQQKLQGTWAEYYDDKLKQSRKAFVNANGENVTPGSDRWKYYSGLRDQAFERLWKRPDTSPHVDPTATDNDGNLVAPIPAATPANSPAPVSLDTPQNRAPIVAGMPAAAIPSSTSPDYSSFPAGPPASFQADPAAKSALEELPDVKAYSTAKPIYLGFADAAKAAVATPHPVNDLALAEAYTKLFDPTARITEFKYDELKKAIPWLDKFKDAPAIIAREHTFPAAVRQEIIRSGAQNIDLKERALQPRFEWAQGRNPTILDNEQKAILAGVPFSQRFGIPATGSALGTGFKTLPSVRTATIPGIGAVNVGY